MGQSSSRARTPPAAPQADYSDSAQPEASTSSQRTEREGREGIQPSRSTGSLANKRSRRSSLRHSILGLIPQSHSSGSLRSSSSGTDSSQPPKKRWRSSRRWSKAPAHLADLPPERAHVGAQSEVAVARTVDAPMVVEGIDERPSAELSTHVDSRTYDDTGHPTDEEIHRELAEFLEEGDPLAEPSASHVQSSPEMPSDASASIPEQPPTSADPSPQSARQFPPPGTLVVVQGVVNTTDTPSPAPQVPSSSTLRPSRSAARRPVSAFNPVTPPNVSLRRSASTPRTGEERLGPRSRLSSFIARPSSMLGRRTPTDAETSPQDSDSSDSSDFVSSTSHDIPADQSSASSQAAEIQEPSREDDGGRGRPLSPGSIDVLGTLLSVAAAATAASLFSPSFALNSGGLSNDSASSTSLPPGSNRPLSPTPTAGLGSLGGLGNLTGLGFHPGNTTNALPMPGQRDGRDRIRNVWESFRDRLGLNARNAGLPGTNVPVGGAAQESASEGEARLRPGEVMLAEMARALNIGLGLSGDNASSRRSVDQASTEAPAGGSDAPASTGTEGDRASPAEDSFEQFLINLQADLRAALSEDTSTESQDDSLPAPADQDTPESIHNVSRPTSVQEAVPSTSAEGRATETPEAVDNDEPPPLAELSDSSDEELGADGDDDDDETFEDDVRHGAEPSYSHSHSHRTPTPIPASGLPFVTEPQLPAGGERRPPGINLWRLYRFQPIPASHTQMQHHAASTSRATSPIPNTASASPQAPDGPGSEPSLQSDPNFQPDHPHDLSVPPTSPPTSRVTDAPASGLNVVVPVIVVGLQSVDMAHAHDDPMLAQDDIPHHTESGTAGNGRTWQSRAANALRTLRPGRRGSSRGRQNNDGAGSRTFLIYVIGGYYPPNHHMVTGSDSLDSYEALWELAELLGQVKPPVASRDDIEHSGLQILKSSELLQYEREGKLSSNCVERCLICLDDYEEDDELRLMSCKHAFHKTCVDKWLQVGRNNCPACRTKGVSTPSDSSS